MSKLTQGEKNRRANIRAMKAIGRKNAKLRAAAKVDAYLAHVEAMNQRSIDAAAARQARRAAGIAKRDAHNLALHNAMVRDVAAQLVELADKSAATSATAQSPVTANVYAIDARQKRDMAARVLATIGEKLPLAKAA